MAALAFGCKAGVTPEGVASSSLRRGVASGIVTATGTSTSSATATSTSVTTTTSTETGTVTATSTATATGTVAEIDLPPTTVTVSAIAPAAGYHGGGTTLQLTGSGFRRAMTVKLDGVACTNVAVTSATSASCAAPAHAPGAVDVAVTTAPGFGLTLAASYDYVRTWVYAPNTGTNSISAFDFNVDDGSMTELTGSPFATGNGPTQLAVSPDKTLGYVTLGDNVLGGFHMDRTTGALTPVTGSPFTIDDYPNDVLFDPTGLRIYANSTYPGSISGYSVDPTTGALTPLAGSPSAAGYFAFGLTRNAAGTCLFTSDYHGAEVDSYVVNTTTGAVGAAVASATATKNHELALTPDGKYLYVAGNTGNEVLGFSVNQSTCALTALAGSPWALGSGGAFTLTVTPDSGRVYVTTGDNEIFGFAVDPATGNLSALPGSPYGATAGLSTPWGSKLDPTGRFLIVANRGGSSLSVFSVDQATGALTYVGAKTTQAGPWHPTLVIDR